jgi:hypothetical protein
MMKDPLQQVDLEVRSYSRDGRWKSTEEKKQVNSHVNSSAELSTLLLLG